MATKVEESQVEVDERIAFLAPRLRGLRDLSTLTVSPSPDDMSPRAHEEVLESIKAFERRLKLLTDQRSADIALMADGHPDMPPMRIDPVALASILDNAASVALAAGTFVTNADPAATLNLTAGGVEPK